MCVCVYVCSLFTTLPFCLLFVPDSFLHFFSLHFNTEDGHLSQLAGAVWEAFHHSRSNEVPLVQTATLASLPPVLPALPSSHLQQAAQELTTLLLDPSSLPSLRLV